MKILLQILTAFSVTSFSASLLFANDIKFVHQTGDIENQINLGGNEILDELKSIQSLLQDERNIPLFFPKTIEEIDSLFCDIKTRVLSSLKKITSISPIERTFENTILEYDRVLAYCGMQSNIFEILLNLHPDKEIFRKVEDVFIRFEQWIIEVVKGNEAIYKAFKEYQATSKEVLNDERRYYLVNAMSEFSRQGLDLAPEKLIEIKNLQKKAASLAVAFISNFSKAPIPTFTATLEDLKGVSANFIGNLDKSGDGKYIVKCDRSSFKDIMFDCEVESARKNFHLQFCDIGFPENMAVLNDLINTRDSLARLLGYDSYASFNIAPEMAKTVKTVESFLRSLFIEGYSKVREIWDAILINIPEKVLLDEEGKIKVWDNLYLKNQFIKKNFHLNKEEIREYFPAEKIIRGLLDFYERFLNLKFEVKASGGYWDSSVQSVEVRAKGDDQVLIGYILLDLFRREGKYYNAFCVSLVPSISLGFGEAYSPALAVISANFPLKDKENFSLLYHNDVITFCHEFGHAIHALLGRAEMTTKAAYNTVSDFVETPSQLFEKWAWDRDILKAISKHYQTNAPLSDSVIDQLFAVEDFFAYDEIRRNLFYANLSLSLFKEGQNKDIMGLVKKSQEVSSEIFAYGEMHNVCSFGHLANPTYEAKFYSYLWSQRMAENIFSYIKSHGGLLDPIMGARYVSKIIGLGGSVDPNILVDAFLLDDNSYEND